MVVAQVVHRVQAADVQVEQPAAAAAVAMCEIMSAE